MNLKAGQHVDDQCEIDVNSKQRNMHLKPYFRSKSPSMFKLEPFCFSVLIFQPSVIPSNCFSSLDWSKEGSFCLMSYLWVEHVDHVPERLPFSPILYHLLHPEVVDINLLSHVVTEVRILKTQTIGEELFVILVDAVPCQVALKNTCGIKASQRKKHWQKQNGIREAVKRCLF